MKADPKGSLEYFSDIDAEATNGHSGANGKKRTGEAMAVDEAKKVKV